MRKELSKTNNSYLTFSTKSATRHVVAYLNDRLVRGESLHADSPVIAPDHIYKTGRGRNSSKDVPPDATDRQAGAESVPAEIRMEAVRAAGVL